MIALDLTVFRNRLSVPSPSFWQQLHFPGSLQQVNVLSSRWELSLHTRWCVFKPHWYETPRYHQLDIFTFQVAACCLTFWVSDGFSTADLRSVSLLFFLSCLVLLSSLPPSSCCSLRPSIEVPLLGKKSVSGTAVLDKMCVSRSEMSRRVRVPGL